MRKLNFLLLLGIPILIASCSTDNGEGIGNGTPVVVGVYNLTEVNINVAQDPNEDSMFSTNMVEELSCMNGSLNIRVDNTWNMTLTAQNITTVTGDFYPVFCGESRNYSGNWTFQNNQLNLNSTFFAPFVYNDAVLVENVNEKLPGILNRKFERQ